MRAARMRVAGEPWTVEDIARPVVGSNDVLVDLKRASLCGTDVHFWNGEMEPEADLPLTMGHEGAGVVEEVGSNVENIEAGDRVVVNYIIPCSNCRFCFEGQENRCPYATHVTSHVDGTFAEYIAVPANSVVKMGDEVPYSWGSIAACAVSTAYHAVSVSQLHPGDTAVVFGTGGVGLHAVLWADFFGARKVIAVDPVASKLEAAKAYGADLVVNPTEEDVVETVAPEVDEWGADVVIECSGSKTAIEQGIAVANGDVPVVNGNVVSVGVQEEPFEVEYFGIREGMVTVSGDHQRSELREILALLADGKVSLDQSVTHTIALDDIADGIALVESNEEHVERVVLDLER